MIYNYYCTNCGHELRGVDIIFDLAQMLDLHSGNGEDLFIKFSPIDLQELAQSDGQNLNFKREQIRKLQKMTGNRIL